MAGPVQAPLTSIDVELEPIQLVAPDGTPTTETRYRRDLPSETLAWLYESMVVTRDLDGEFVNLQRQGELALFASCRGQEAAQIGATASLRKTDWLFPQYREIGAFLLRGITPAQMGAVWRGTWHGGLGFTEKCVAPIAIPIGTQGLHAVGAAMAAQRLGEDSVTLAFLGDGATSEGDVHEALNLAAVFKAPCVFFVQNNQWAISVPVSRQMAGPSIAHRAIGYGMPGIRVDGNDVLACHAVTAEAAQRAREGGGPTLIEAVTYRMGPHTTSDDPTRYRSDEELEYWAARDPIRRYRTYLQAIGVWTERLEERVEAKSKRLRTELREAVVDADDVDITEVFDTVYHDITPDLLAQRDQVLAELAKECLGERSDGRQEHDTDHRAATAARRGRARAARRAGGTAHPKGRGRAKRPGKQRSPLLTPVPLGPPLARGTPTLTMAQAINRALHDAMAADERVLVFGEDVATLGGVFRVTEGLSETFGEQRCFDTPLAESAIIGIAIGMAIRGFVPVPEIQFDGFAAPCVRPDRQSPGEIPHADAR